MKWIMLRAKSSMRVPGAGASDMPKPKVSGAKQLNCLPNLRIKGAKLHAERGVSCSINKG